MKVKLSPSMGRSSSEKPEVHRDCVTSRNIDKKTGLEQVVLGKGHLLFRGTRGSSQYYQLPIDKPAFFAGPETAFGVYSQGDENCRVWRLTSNVRLLDLSAERNLALLAAALPSDEYRQVWGIYSGYGRKSLGRGNAHEVNENCWYTDKPETQVAICTEGFLRAEDARTENYFAIHLAKGVCELGFDGWVIGSTYDRSYGSYRSAGGSREPRHAFTAEVMLCRPYEHLVLLEPWTTSRTGRCSHWVRPERLQALRHEQSLRQRRP